MHRTHGILVAVSSTPVCYHCAVFHFALRQVPIVMTLQLNSRTDFTVENYAAVAWGGAPVVFSPAALQRMADCRASFMRLIDSDPEVTIYGVTSGYGQFARVRLKPDERRAHAKKPPYGAHAAFGPPLPERVARGIVFARLANYVEGHGAVTPALAQAVAQMLD